MVDFRKIPSDYLVPGDVPCAGAEWNEIVAFSSTFDLAEMHDVQLTSRELSSIDQNTSLTELRSLLFYQWRRWNHFGRPPETVEMTGIHRLIERIRARVEAIEPLGKGSKWPPTSSNRGGTTNNLPKAHI